jgi:hypothetical protein
MGSLSASVRDVTDVVFAPVVQKSMMSYLEGAIVEFLTHYSSIFGTDSLNSKVSLYDSLSTTDRHVWSFTSIVVHEIRSQTPVFQSCYFITRQLHQCY